MNNYEKLRTPEASRNLSDKFRQDFEQRLSKAVGYWQEHGKLVDQFEDDSMELSFAKGYLAACIDMQDLFAVKTSEWIRDNHAKYYGPDLDEDGTPCECFMLTQFIDGLVKSMEE